MVASPTLMPVIVFPSTLYVAGRAREAKMCLLADRPGPASKRLCPQPYPSCVPQHSDVAPLQLLKCPLACRPCWPYTHIPRMGMRY